MQTSRQALAVMFGYTYSSAAAAVMLALVSVLKKPSLVGYSQSDAEV
jgi:hypothetical protein